jgi:DHA2 family multidrug resistance protein-like MFS transporter
MIVPATLAGIRSTFRRRASAIWRLGCGGSRRRGFRPAGGGILLEHFYWGSVFLINVPIVLAVIALSAGWCRASRRAANSRLI